jgi:hypothetical protein
MKDHDGELLYSFVRERYYSDPEEALELEENEEFPLAVNHLELVICEPGYARVLETEFFTDDFDEDTDLPQELVDLIDEFNERAKKVGPICYFPGKFRLNTKPWEEEEE